MKTHAIQAFEQATTVADYWAVRDSSGSFRTYGLQGFQSAIDYYANIYLMCKIGRKPTWWMLLAMLPCVGEHHFSHHHLDGDCRGPREIQPPGEAAD